MHRCRALGQISVRWASSAAKFAPEDTATSFAPFTNRDLAVTAAMLAACANPTMMDAGRRAVQRAFDVVNGNDESSASISPSGARLAAASLLWCVKRTAFRHYCAGEHLEDCAALSRKLAPSGVRLIVDHSVEEREEVSAWEHNLEQKRRLLTSLRNTLGDEAVFIPVKITALASPSMLDRVSLLLRQQGEGWESKPLCTDDVRAQLESSDVELFDAAIANLSALCEQATSVGVPLLLDAEASPRQPAVDVIALELMRRYNRGRSGNVDEFECGSACDDTVMRARPFVYNTYQMYLRDAGTRLTRDMKQMAAEDVIFAAKIVRGAYMVAENTDASKEGRDSPVHFSKDATDAQYNDAVRCMLRSIAGSAVSQGSNGVGPGAAVVIATHNRGSVEAAVEEMCALGLPNNHPNVHIAQIMGICDHVTCALGASGYNALKLVLFGEFDEIFPWLLRRLEENSDLMGAPLLESPLVTRELRRRLGAGVS